jgi:hypothetical protein
MPKLLTVGSEEFEFPLEGQNAGYGSEVTDWAEAVTDALTTVQKPNDILTTTAVINNIAGTFSIPGFNFSVAEVISIDCRYFVKRVTTSPDDNFSEVGYIEGYYDGSEWGISIRTTGDAKILLSITSSGQFQYTLTPSDVLAGSHTGSITFEAKVINK